jgi:hypothetical protein
MTNEVKSSRFFSGRLDLTIITPLFNYWNQRSYSSVMNVSW